MAVNTGDDSEDSKLDNEEWLCTFCNFRNLGGHFCLAQKCRRDRTVVGCELSSRRRRAAPDRFAVAKSPLKSPLKSLPNKRRRTKVAADATELPSPTHTLSADEATRLIRNAASAARAAAMIEGCEDEDATDWIRLEDSDDEEGESTDDAAASSALPAGYSVLNQLPTNYKRLDDEPLPPRTDDVVVLAPKLAFKQQQYARKRLAASQCAMQQLQRQPSRSVLQLIQRHEPRACSSSPKRVRAPSPQLA